jgi:acyl-CoA thioesterase FadM
MDGWIETCRSVVSPWECDVTEHFTIAYYFDRLGTAASTLAESLNWHNLPRPVGQRFDVRFARELRVAASFHVVSGPIALGETAMRLGHQVIDSADGEVAAWAEEKLDFAASPLPRKVRDVIAEQLVNWPGPAVERRPEPTALDGFIPTVRDRVRPMDLDGDGKCSLAAFVHRFTAASIQGLAAIGATSRYMQDERRGYSTFELALEVSGWPQLGDPLRVETGVAHLGNSSIRFVHRMSDPRTGSEYARLGQFGVQLDLDKRRPAALPEPLRLAARRMLIAVS